jgi:hypothetical protein
MAPLAFAFVLASFTPPPQAAGDSKREVPVTQRAVDVMTLRSGERLLGCIVIPPPAESVQILVRRDWLKRTAPAFQRDRQQVEAENVRRARLELRDRIQHWQKQRTEPRTLAVFLEEELRRVETEIEQMENGPAQDPAQLMLLEFPKTQVFSHFHQPVERRRILPLAWEHRLANPEDRSAAALARELEAEGLDVQSAPADLSGRVPVQRQTDREWAARVGLTGEHEKGIENTKRG